MAPHAAAPHHAFWPARLPRTLTVPETPLWHNLATSAARYPHKAAYLFAGASLSYTELLQQAEALAGWLQQVARVEPGERVLLFMQNCPQYAAAFYGILRADAVVVPVNPMNRADEFGHYITDPDLKVVITSADLAAVVQAADAALPPAQRLTHLLVTRMSDALPARGSQDPADAPPPALADWPITPRTSIPLLAFAQPGAWTLLPQVGGGR